MPIPSVLKASVLRVVVAWLVLSGTTSAIAGTVSVDRDQLQQLLRTLTQQIAIAQQQIDQSPNGRVQLAVAAQQLQAAQAQLGELLRQISMAQPDPPYMQPGPQYPQPGPQYPQPGPQYPQPGPQYPQSGPQYPPPGPQYPQPGYPPQAPGPQYPQPGPQYPQPGYPPQAPGPQYPPPGPAYPPPGPQYPPALSQSPMSDANFSALLQQLSAASSPNDKLSTLRQSSSGNYFLSDQVLRILRVFIYIADRTDALQLLAPQITDGPARARLLPLFPVGSDRDKAQSILLGTAPPPPR